MANKIDELFSPERLGKNWRLPEKSDVRPTVQKSAQTAMELFERIKDLIKEHFSKDEAIALKPLLQELEMLLLQMFPEPGKDFDPKLDPQKDQADLSLSLNGALNRIEDLIEAFGIKC